MVRPPPPRLAVTRELLQAVERSVVEFGDDILDRAAGNAVMQHKIPDGVSYPTVFSSYLRGNADMKEYTRVHEKPYAATSLLQLPEGPDPLSGGRFECTQERSGRIRVSA